MTYRNSWSGACVGTGPEITNCDRDARFGLRWLWRSLAQGVWRRWSIGLFLHLAFALGNDVIRTAPWELEVGNRELTSEMAGVHRAGA